MARKALFAPTAQLTCFAASPEIDVFDIKESLGLIRKNP
jgi:hypothetical protein